MSPSFGAVLEEAQHKRCVFGLVAADTYLSLEKRGSDVSDTGVRVNKRSRGASSGSALRR